MGCLQSNQANTVITVLNVADFKPVEYCVPEHKILKMPNDDLHKKFMEDAKKLCSEGRLLEA